MRVTGVFGRWAGCALALAALVSPPARAADEPRAPALALPRLEGGAAFALESLSGKVVLVDFWASWCTPCRHSLPAYETLFRELGPRGFAVVAVNLDENEGDATQFLAQHPLSYVVLRDSSSDSARAWGVRGMPSSYLVACDGTIRTRHAGFKKADVAALRAKIESLLQESRCDAPDS